jgi:hypothetical protein
MLFSDAIANIAALVGLEWAKRQLRPAIYEMASRAILRIHFFQAVAGSARFWTAPPSGAFHISRAPEGGAVHDATALKQASSRQPQFSPPIRGG